MKTFLQDNNSNELIILFNGWGMDEKPFLPIKSDCDILFLSNYNDLVLDFSLDFTKYEKINLVAFSAGVFMAAILQDKLPKINFKVAVNGTLNLFDKKNGVPENILNEMKNLALENAIDFRKKIISDENSLIQFNENQPVRDLDSSLRELSMLERYYLENKNVYLEFDKVFIGKDDKILPTERQLLSWGNHNNIQQIKGGHFLFYNFKNLNKLIKP